jgi:hypothetical protein
MKRPAVGGKAMATGHHVHRRRDIIKGAGVVAAAALASGASARGDGARKEDEEETKVTPTEDLMREHAVLSRLLLIYETGLPAGPGREAPPLKEIGDAARLVRTFIEEYHEKLEEDYLFPRFEKAGKLVELVKTLRRQHEAGRRLTGAILEVTSATGTPDTARLERNLYDSFQNLHTTPFCSSKTYTVCSSRRSWLSRNGQKSKLLSTFLV